jgi:hypothetical protein
MKYFLNYQTLAKGAVRPEDRGQAIEIDIQADGHAIIPNVGDYVSIDNSNRTDMASISGKVKSRLFTYLLDACPINIVLEETVDAEWAALIKE